MLLYLCIPVFNDSFLVRDIGVYVKVIGSVFHYFEFLLLYAYLYEILEFNIWVLP